MNQKQSNRIIQLLKRKGVSFDKGLSDDEIAEVEQLFSFHFPDDLKLLLQTALPVSKGFAHWRYAINSDDEKKDIEERLNWPLRGMLFDIKHGSFWLKEWGIKPANFDDQKKIAEREVAKQPTLIPIFSHRYISAEPTESGNPVFSVYKTDIIYYGMDLMDYLANEFRFQLPSSFGTIEDPKPVRFWGDIVS